MGKSGHRYAVWAGVMLSGDKVKVVVRDIKCPNVEIKYINESWIKIALLDSRESRRNGDSAYNTPRELIENIHGPWDSVRHLLKCVFAGVQMLKDHELREWFTYQGIIVFDPHNPQQRTSDAKMFYQYKQMAILHDPDVHTTREHDAYRDPSPFRQDG